MPSLSKGLARVESWGDRSSGWLCHWSTTRLEPAKLITIIVIFLFKIHSRMWMHLKMMVTKATRKGGLLRRWSSSIMKLYRSRNSHRWPTIALNAKLKTVTDAVDDAEADADDDDHHESSSSSLAWRQQSVDTFYIIHSCSYSFSTGLRATMTSLQVTHTQTAQLSQLANNIKLNIISASS